MIVRVICCTAVFLGLCRMADGRVAPGFVDWSGAVDKNHIAGRYISDSDLRHRFIVIVEFESDKACEQLAFAVSGRIAVLDNIDPSGLAGEFRSWENRPYPRDCLVVYVSRGKGQVRSVANSLAAHANDENLTWMTYFRPVYEGITFPDAPKGDGKYPFVYVMPPSGTSPIFSGPCEGEKTERAIGAAIDSYLSKTGRWPKWRPFYGLVESPKFFPQLAKSLRAGKSLQPVLKACEAGIKSADADKAREAQLLYDAIEQTRGDIGYRILRNAHDFPHCAVDDIRRLHRHWPSLPTHLGDLEKALLTEPIPALADIYGLIIDCETYADSWTVGEAAAARASIKKALGKARQIKNGCDHAKAQGLATAFEQELQQIDARLAVRPAR